MKKAVVFNIQKFCVHDGPGIRTTVFFKGCPLSCLWCHNPEGRSFKREMLINLEKCSGCGQCRQICARGAVSMTASGPVQDESRCVLCEKCVDYCLNSAREVAGREYTVEELMVEIEKDRPFYDQSGGGVTFSGGEALWQIDFLADLAGACKNRGIPVAVDTCGYAPFTSFERILDYVDVFLYDIKLMDPDLHAKYTGKDNRLILENLGKLAGKGANINLRLPLIEGINAGDGNIASIIDFIRGMNISRVNLLPYHDLGRAKYARLAGEYRPGPLSAPPGERMEEIKRLFEANNYKVKIGG
ncbi:MAG: glycyl-radical enzyme activating protein [Peptococcaceae bacterium]|nr:glycyl-radical enzyme activating protein [Peptococcaceae bacterium]